LRPSAELQLRLNSSPDQMAPVVTTDDEVVLAVLAHAPVCVLLFAV
jgi:hypothetical protein